MGSYALFSNDSFYVLPFANKKALRNNVAIVGQAMHLFTKAFLCFLFYRFGNAVKQNM